MAVRAAAHRPSTCNAFVHAGCCCTMATRSEMVRSSAMLSGQSAQCGAVLRLDCAALGSRLFGMLCGRPVAPIRIAASCLFVCAILEENVSGC